MQTLDEKVNLVRTAIAERMQIVTSYRTHQRICCPHSLGEMGGRWAVRVWQFEGSSSRPHTLPNWRNFFVDELSDITLRDGEWHRGWMIGKRPHQGFERIDTSIAPEFAAEIRRAPPPRKSRSRQQSR